MYNIPPGIDPERYPLTYSVAVASQVADGAPGEWTAEIEAAIHILTRADTRALLTAASSHRGFWREDSAAALSIACDAARLARATGVTP